MSISPQTWQTMKPLIEQFYRDEELHLKLVLPKVRREGFNPTEAQLRNKLKKWGIRKPNRKQRACPKKGSQSKVTKVKESYQQRTLRPKPPGILREPCANPLQAPAAGPAPTDDSHFMDPAYQEAQSSYPTPAIFSGTPGQETASRFDGPSAIQPMPQTYPDLPVFPFNDFAITSPTPGTVNTTTVPSLSSLNTPYSPSQNFDGAQTTNFSGITANKNDSRTDSRQLLTPEASTFSSPSHSTSIYPPPIVGPTSSSLEDSGGFLGLLHNEGSMPMFFPDSNTMGSEATTGQTPLQSLGCGSNVNLAGYGCSPGISVEQAIASMGQPSIRPTYSQPLWYQGQHWDDSYASVPRVFNGPAYYDHVGNYKLS